MAITLNGDTGISSIGALSGVTSVSSAAANTPVILQDSSSNSNTCRAWVNFNGTGTVAIRGSFNVSSITDNGTGDYTVNFTNSLTDSNYSFTSSIDWGNTAFGASARSTCIVSLATTNARTRTGYLDASATFTAEDETVICVSIFR